MSTLPTDRPESETRPAPRSVDALFSASFPHRLRFTDDVLGPDQSALAEVLEPSGDQPSRVQFWVDGYVASAMPDLVARLEAFAGSQPDRFMAADRVHIVPGGEAIKNDRDHLETILRAINDADLDRRSYMVVVGGGAVLDAVGFAAAIAHRGIRLVRLPTTTLAQADSGVGVKNAINYFGKKNWLGAFAVPWAVINDTRMLSTLPDRDFICGFSEAVKVALLKSPDVFDQLCRGAEKIRRRDLDVALPMIRASVEFHLAHITKGGDPFESREARPLDFGHWSAHKMEPMSQFSLRHGEAVAIGLAIDVVYSTLAHGLPEADADKILKCLTDLGFRFDHPTLQETRALFGGLEEFRQHLGGRLTVTMLRGIGDPLDVHEVDDAKMLRAIEVVSKYHAPAGPSATLSASRSPRPALAASTSSRNGAY